MAPVTLSMQINTHGELLKSLLHLVETVADCRLVGCDPLGRASFRVLHMVARDWSRASVHRLLPLDHY